MFIVFRVAAAGDDMCLARSTADSDILVYNNDDNNDDDELMAFAVAAGDAMDEESDPELFSVSMPSPDIDMDSSSMSPIYSSVKTLEKMEEMSQVENTDTCTNTALDLADRKGRQEDAACEKTPKQGIC